MKREHRFTSILLAPARGGEAEREVYDPATGKKSRRSFLSYDPESARRHVMEIGPGMVFSCRSWVSSALLSLLVAAPISVLAAGILVIGLKMDLNPIASVAGRVFIASMALSYALILLAIGVPAAVRRLKYDLVEKERGPGNWKIVADDRWERFERMLRLKGEGEE
ncbi:MAG: hypothetical protein JW838_14825 [Spirochaetes bacterium]|nr:hypothetical protein [Spirochaetota bacterium]